MKTPKRNGASRTAALAATMKANMDRIGHIQLAGNPGRHEPGAGEINYPCLFDCIDRIGYQGWFGCEYIPSTTTAEGLAWFDPYRPDKTA